jgi:hypothetical protein
LSLSLFKDSMLVNLKAEARILWGAVRLLGLAIVPMLVMLVPMCLLLGQLAVWYQARPLAVGEGAIITVQLATPATEPTDVQLEPSSAVETITGPVRIPVRQMVCWNVQAREPGYHRLAFRAGDALVEKEIAIGDGFMRVSPRRPAWSSADALLYPRERPLSADSPVAAIDVEYPPRTGWTDGTRTWLIYWFAASMVAALVARPLLKVNI